MAGMKSYLLAAVMVIYAGTGFFYFHTLDLNTAMGVIAAAGALVGIRSGLSTEINKLLAALGVDVQGTTLTPSGIQSTGSKLVTALRTIATPAGGGKALGFLIAAILIAPGLTGCQTYNALFNSGTSMKLCSTPSQCVYQAKGGFAAALALAVAYHGLQVCPTNAPVCKDPATDAAIKVQAVGVQNALNAADALVNSGLLPNGAKATADQIQAAATDAATQAASFNTAALALPHN